MDPVHAEHENITWIPCGCACPLLAEERSLRHEGNASSDCMVSMKIPIVQVTRERMVCTFGVPGVYTELRPSSYCTLAPHTGEPGSRDAGQPQWHQLIVSVCSAPDQSSVQSDDRMTGSGSSYPIQVRHGPRAG